VLFADSFTGFSRYDRKDVGLQLVYPQRKLQPLQVTAFSQFFLDWAVTLICRQNKRWRAFR
jgi:hypothetical protein